MSESVHSDMPKLRLKGDVQEAPAMTPGCEVCKNWPMLVPIYQCAEGHLICSLCYANFHCPTCNVPLPENKIRNRAAEILQPPLTNCSQDGCDKIFANEGDMSYHVSENCNYIEVPLCSILGKACNLASKPINVYDTLKHLQTVHGATISYGENALAYQWNFEVQSSETSADIGKLKLWCIGENKAALILQFVEIGKRVQIRLFSFGDFSTISSLYARLYLSMSMESLTGLPFDSKICGKEIGVRFDAKMVQVTQENAQIYKEVHILDAGPAVPGMRRKLGVQITNGFYDVGSQSFLGSATIGDDPPDYKPIL